MPAKLITPQQIQQATLRIKCGEEEGSAFFVSDTLVLTARHVIIDAIDEEKQILGTLAVLGTNQEPIICILLGHGGENLDIALLQVPPQSSAFALPLFGGQVRYNAHWETFGFPFAHQISGNRYLGSVRKTNIDKPYDIELTNDSIDNKLDYSGLSGSPLVIDNEVYGVITYNITDGFGAISILKIAEFLDLYDIPYRVQKDLEDLPDNFKELDSIVPNEETLALLDNKLVSGGKFYIIHGSPGSGKTLICATYQFNNQNSVVAGRYFVRLPDDQRPISYRVSREAFLEWMEDLISQKLSGSFYPKQSVSWDQRVKNFQSLLIALNDYYIKKNEIGYIILDGLDDINEFSPNGLIEFLGILPETLPDHLSFVLSIIRKNSLPANVQASITSNEEIKVRPLEIDQCSYYLHDKLKSIEPRISTVLLQKLAEKSEGHPLYLRYISELLKGKQPEDLEIWIDQLPNIDGEIERYYEQIWQTDFATDQDKFWIALIVSQLRQPIPNDALLQILPESSRVAFVSKFPTILHLFKVSDKADIYHSSFRLFIERKSEYLLPSAHDYIVNYCKQADTSSYSITNIVYHTLHSSQPFPAIDCCDQEWADACAKISVEPELVLNDIVSVESYCLEEGNFTGFIRIKLLIQRIRFRYDNVLAANASEIARVLLALGNPSYALKYIVRFSNLIISDEESIWFLRKFNQIGAYEEFKILHRAIQSRYKALIELASNENYFPFRVYDLLVKSTTINLANNPAESAKKVMGILQSLKKIAEMPENKGLNADSINNFRQEIGAFFTGFVTYQRNQYTKSATFFRKQMPQIPAAEWAGGFAHTALAFNKIVESEISSDHKIIYDLIVEDIEFAIDNYGYLLKDAVFIYASILEESKRPDIIKKLISEVYSSIPTDKLREENGVDANISGMHSIINFQEGIGYLDEIGAYPNQHSLFVKDWEGALLQRIKLIGFCFGKAWRFRAEEKMEEVKEILPYISNMLEDFQFSLKERSRWDRGYAIPEQIFPHIYYKLTRFYIEFASYKLEGFISLILNNPSGQLGLYTEGYREVLSNIVQILSKSESFGILTVSILKILEEHILIATQNRWERVPALLEISNSYAKLGNNEKAMQVYQHMLDTSMGPTWYKEDQFSLINTALSLPKISRENFSFQDFSKQLEFASGELTFQRYVRVAQQEFVGNMSSQGSLAPAISYYKYQTLPEPFQVIANAESSTIDAVIPGDGYKLGARNIVEARGIINLLKHSGGDPIIIWAFTEVFIINDDVYRYIDQFAELQATCIQRVLQDEASPELQFFRDRLISCVTDSRLDDNRHHYLKDLLEYLPEQEYDFLVDSLKDSGISFPKPAPPVKERSPEEDAHMDSFNFPGLGKQVNLRKLPEMLSQVRKQLEMENKSKASEIIAEALLMLHHGKADIWMGSSLGKDVGELWKKLSLTVSVPEILKLIKVPITEHYTQDWRIVDKLLRSLKTQIDETQTTQILEIVREHIFLMIRDPKTVDGFNWEYIPEDFGVPIDIQLIDLLIWLLNHPYISFKKRVIEALIMLCELRPVVISQLYLRLTSSDNSVVREICAYLLYRLSESHTGLLLKEIDFNSELKAKMIWEENFMIRYYLLKMVENLKMQAPSLEDFYQGFILSFPEKISQGADVNFEEPYMILISPIINSFKELNILNGVFCREFLKKIDEISKPLSIFDQIRAGHYVERSYYDNEVHYRSAVHILRQAFNLTISSRVTRDNIEKASSILKHSYLHEN